MPVDVLVIGLSSSGKSFLVKKLRQLSSSVFEEEQHLKKKKKKKPSNSSSSSDVSFWETVPSVGVNMDRLYFPNGLYLSFREVGGALVATWERYLSDCSSILFVVDSSNTFKMAPTVIELLNVIKKVPSSKPILVVYNKIDVPQSVSFSSFKKLLRWSDLCKHRSNLHALDISNYEDVHIQSIYDLINSIHSCLIHGS
mmetsp:Transcript_2326/g.3372  ORF Transcript_2326/g.3372 Transcript_2326/m.3372 type:complete len:198 (+) Transcript_2326:28-621(+)